MNFDVFEYTNSGGRSYNEDCLSHKVVDDRGIFVVADGLGGHSLGELASAEICKTMVEEWTGEFPEDLETHLRDAIATSNQNILAIKEERRTELKSTVVALAVDEKKAVWANVGDSRLYFISNGEIRGITNDHSVAFKKYKSGEITRDMIRYDEDQSALLRSVGGESRNEPEIYFPGESIKPGDGFLLCSDGVWEYLFDEEVLFDCMKASSAKQWAENLLMRVIDRVPGDHDNLSIMAIRIQ